MKYLNHMRSKMVQNFTCEILVYDTCISNVKWNIHLWNFQFTYGIETIKVGNISFVCEIVCEIYKEMYL